VIEKTPNVVMQSVVLPVYFLATNLDFVYQLLYLILSVIGLFYYPCFSFHLLDISLRSPQTRSVLKAVTGNGLSIILTALLGVSIIYVYSVIGFFLLRSNYSDPLDCSTLFHCILTTFDYGIRNGGGIGDALNPYNSISPYFWLRFFFDTTFFIIIIIITLNIVFGIILDTFGELRDTREKIEEDIRSKCFICSIAADVFQRQALGFKHHIKNEHNMWHYLYFFIYLDEKDKDEYTAAEEYVEKKKASNETDYFPIIKSICLTNFLKSGQKLEDFE